MQTITATDAKQQLAALLDAAQREPVMIQRQKRDVAVVLSPQEYQRLRGLNIQAFEQFCERVANAAAARGLTEESLREILAE